MYNLCNHLFDHTRDCTRYTGNVFLDVSRVDADYSRIGKEFNIDTYIPDLST